MTRAKTTTEQVPEAETAPLPDMATGDTAQTETGAGATPEPRPAITVIGPKKGRWRAGRFFTAEPVTIPVDELTEDELVALDSDPRLTIATGLI